MFSAFAKACACDRTPDKVKPELTKIVVELLGILIAYAVTPAISIFI